jgi:uncharacterized membrane protein
MNRRDLSRYAITAIVGGSGVLHLTSPKFYKAIMPQPLKQYDAQMVFPANLQAALDGGMHHLDAPWNSPQVAWGRLPFQLPMILMALAVARQPGPATTRAAGEPQAA